VDLGGNLGYFTTYSAVMGIFFFSLPTIIAFFFSLSDWLLGKEQRLQSKSS
jgi:hypothetical protein